jgi:hypothetical protein
MAMVLLCMVTAPFSASIRPSAMAPVFSVNTPWRLTPGGGQF